MASLERQAIIVAGMHRSGTSAVTRVINLLGADLPGNLLGSNAGNTQGHWESVELINLHDEMLTAARSRWSSVFEIEPTWFQSVVAATYAERIAAFLERELPSSAIFVIKDPRIAVFIPIWTQALAHLGMTARFVIPYRNPLEVASSLTKREESLNTGLVWPLGRGLLLWLRYVLAAERETRGAPRAFVDFDKLLDGWDGEMARIGGQLRLVWPDQSRATAQAIDRFLSREHKNETLPNPDAALQRTSPWAHRVWQQLARCASSPCEGAATFDAASAALSEAGVLFEDYVGAADTRAAETLKLESELNSTRAASMARTTELERRLEETEQALRQVEEKRALAEECLAAVEASTSWRLTLPLRKAVIRVGYRGE